MLTDAAPTLTDKQNDVGPTL